MKEIICCQRMRMLFHFCCAAILMLPWVPRKHQGEIHTLAQSQIKQASCRAFHRRLNWLCALVYSQCMSRGRGGDCSSCSSPQSKLGQLFQGVLTRDSRSFVTRLLISFSVWWSLWPWRCRDCFLEGWSHQTSLTSIQAMSWQQGRVIHITGRVYSSESSLLRSCAVVGKCSLSFLWASGVECWTHLTSMKGGSIGNKTVLDLINRTPLLSWLRRDCFFLVHG